MRINKTILTLTLMAVIAVSAYSQYDSERDFMVDFNRNGVSIIDYLGTKKEIRIPPRIQGLPVTAIGQSAFQEYDEITSVTIPNGVTSIEKQAFYGCTSLASITIPDSVTSIGQSAFSGCESLTSVIMPNSITSIGTRAFRYCANLTSVTIPNSVTSIGEIAFGDCTSLVSVTFEGTIPADKFYIYTSPFGNSIQPFPGDLRTKFYATNKTNGTPGTYTRPNGNSETWTKQ
jgi:hypothetical protein